MRVRCFGLLNGLMLVACFATFHSAFAQTDHAAMAPMDSEMVMPNRVDGRTVAEKIVNAMSAGPEDISRHAKIIDIDKAGKVTVLREGTNDFTCMPSYGDSHPAMCADGPSMQWARDFAAHRPRPTNTVPGITYMLAGATQRSDSDPYDNKSPLIHIGPHWMIIWPFDPKQTGLPTTHRSTGAYIMWAGTPYAHVHIMGAPSGGLPIRP